ncbi:hypothetical protein DPMN_092403 [Dreissena polymorpha]|uniref:Uncharacterized protein n=1 Tax=Dreissena polymorpha TaxID=45954 RepID=A0A9D4L1G6_DREPO|nr:hypothetical protein DPMN_092403 [Dreissena polymorpha]
MRGPSGRRSLPSFVAIRHLLERYCNRDFRLPIMGLTGPYGPVSVPSATLSPEAMTLRRHYGLLACVDPSGRRSLPSFRRYQTTYSER